MSAGDQQEDLLFICHTCGDRMTCAPDNWEAQQTFRSNHAWPCPYGSNGKPWPWDAKKGDSR